MKNNEKLTLRGTSRLRAWPAGELARRMAGGQTLAEAQADLHPVYDQQVHNLVVTLGKTLAAKFLSGNTATFLAYHAIGTGTDAPASGDTKLKTEVARKAKTISSYVGAQASWSVFYLSTEATFYIKECGWFGDTTAGTTQDSGTLFSHWLQSYDNSGGAYDLTFDYSLTMA